MTEKYGEKCIKNIGTSEKIKIQSCTFFDPWRRPLSPFLIAECAEGFGHVELLAVLDYRGSISLPLFRPLAPINATISLAPQQRSCRVAPSDKYCSAAMMADNGGDTRKEQGRAAQATRSR